MQVEYQIRTIEIRTCLLFLNGYAIIVYLSNRGTTILGPRHPELPTVGPISALPLPNWQRRSIGRQGAEVGGHRTHLPETRGSTYTS